MKDGVSFIGATLRKPRVAFFDFTSCEGCQLQVINNEASLVDFLDLVSITSFREAMSEQSDNYEIAFVEGSITTDREVERLEKIRNRAAVLVALGTCACFGGINKLRDGFGDLLGARRKVYGDVDIQSGDVRAVDEVVKVDMKVFGCPIKKEELEKIAVNIVLGKSVEAPGYPVCMECKANENVCLFEVGEPCLGPVTRAGCDSWCVNGRMGCWGCRGPSDDANIDQMLRIMKKHGFTEDLVMERLECFGGFKNAIERTTEITMRPKHGIMAGKGQ